MLSTVLSARDIAVPKLQARVWVLPLPLPRCCVGSKCLHSVTQYSPYLPPLSLTSSHVLEFDYDLASDPSSWS